MIYNHAFRPSIYTVDECNAIRSAIEQNVNVAIRNMQDQTATNSSIVATVEYGKVKECLEKFANMSIDANKNLFGFDLFQITDYEQFYYNKYPEGTEYNWHTNGTFGECKDFKLTALLNLSGEDYEGGDLEVFCLGSPGSTNIHEFKKPGSFFIFPSWIPHRVTPVTSGTMYSLTMLLAGPNIK